MANKDDYYGTGVATYSQVPEVLKGKILTVIEAIGLEKEQEQAIKRLVSNEIYNEFNNSVGLTAETYTALRQQSEAKDVEATKGGGLTGERI